MLQGGRMGQMGKQSMRKHDTKWSKGLDGRGASRREATHFLGNHGMHAPFFGPSLKGSKFVSYI